MGKGWDGVGARRLAKFAVWRRRPGGTEQLCLGANTPPLPLSIEGRGYERRQYLYRHAYAKPAAR